MSASLSSNYAAMSQIDMETLEAARLDGAGNLRTLWSMALPNSRGTTVSMAKLGVIGALKTFDIPYLITAGDPMHATEFLGTYIYRQGIRQSHLGYAAYEYFDTSEALGALLEIKERN